LNRNVGKMARFCNTCGKRREGYVETEGEKARWEQKTRKKRKTIFAEFGEESVI
jgi:hypothetical protein